jgi:hypothetical protein
LLPQFALRPLLDLLPCLLLARRPLGARLTLRRRHHPRRLTPRLSAPCRLLRRLLCHLLSRLLASLLLRNLIAPALRLHLPPINPVSAPINLQLLLINAVAPSVDLKLLLVDAVAAPINLIPASLVPASLVPSTLVPANLLLVGYAPPDPVGNPAATSQKHLPLRHTRLPEAPLLLVPPMPHAATVIDPRSNARIIEVVEPAKAAADKANGHTLKPVGVSIKLVIPGIIDLLVIIARRAAIGILVHTSAQPKSCNSQNADSQEALGQHVLLQSNGELAIRY